MRDDTFRKMFETAGVVYSQDDLNMVGAIVDRTGSYAPMDEVIRCFQNGELSSAALTFFVPWIWSNKPDDCQVPYEVWHGMFQRTAFTVNRRAAKKPRRTMRLYRGATAANRHGLSWSLDVKQAAYFARSRQAPGARAEMWAANVPADRFYAQYTDGWEQEVTADVRGLQIVPLANEADLPRVFRWPWQRPKSSF